MASWGWGKVACQRPVSKFVAELRCKAGISWFAAQSFSHIIYCISSQHQVEALEIQQTGFTSRSETELTYGCKSLCLYTKGRANNNSVPFASPSVSKREAQHCCQRRCCKKHLCLMELCHKNPEIGGGGQNLWQWCRLSHLGALELLDRMGLSFALLHLTLCKRLEVSREPAFPPSFIVAIITCPS